MTATRTRLTVISLLLVAGTVSWRRGDVFTGSFDVVVVLKALVGFAALGLALATASATGPRRRRLGTGSLWLLGALLVTSLLGALAYGTLLATAVVTVRVVVVAATVVLLLRSAPGTEVIRALVAACGAVATVAAVTALHSPGSLVALPAGRLFGGIPPLNPNELAMLAGMVLLWAGWRAVLGQAGRRHALAAVVALVEIWLTGSRTALLTLVLGLAVMLVQVRRPRPGRVAAALVLVGGLVAAALATGVVTSFLARGDTGTSTLDSRFIAWSASATWARTLWQQLLGGGLSVKLIPVSGQYWTTQLLDSSWVSALVQAGLLGLATAACWVLWALRGAVRAPAPERVLFLGLLAFLVARSALESGLFDATPAFAFFLAVSVLAEGGSRAGLATGTSVGAGPAPKVMTDRSVPA